MTTTITSREMINIIEAALSLGGYKVLVRHLRVPAADTSRHGQPTKVYPKEYLKAYDQEINPRGGQTYVGITGPDGFGLGEAICSMSDNFNRDDGTLLALTRAVHGITGAKALYEEIVGSASFPSIPV